MNTGKSVYVSGARKDRDEIREGITLPLVRRGFHVTHDWTTTEGPSKTDSEASEEICRWYANLCIDAVCRADCLVVDMKDHKYPYQETWAEIGAALAMNKRVYILVSPSMVKTITTNNIFMYANGVNIHTKLHDMLDEFYQEEY